MQDIGGEEKKEFQPEDKKIKAAKETIQADSTRYNYLPGYLKVIFIILTIAGIILGCMIVLGLNIGGWVMRNTVYYYVLFAIF